MSNVLVRRIDAACIVEGLAPASWTLPQGKIPACSYLETQLKRL